MSPQATMTPASTLTSITGWPMSRTLFGSVLVCFMFALDQAHAQPVLQPPLPGGAPLVYTRFRRAAQHAGRHLSWNYPGPILRRAATFGMRPGYLHRVQIMNPPGHPGVSLYPTVEVCGTLYLPPKLHAAAYPAAITFTPEEIDRVIRGVLLTKVIYLEDPEKAFPVASSSDAPRRSTRREGRIP